MITEQELLMKMDCSGYEQDGEKYDFICLKDGKRLHFDNLKELFFFACDNRIVG